MNELLKSLKSESAVLLTAPPGWGKTYKLIEAVKDTRRKVLFVFPLRALCDEVNISGLEKGVRTLNIQSLEDRQLAVSGNFDLIVATPEVLTDELLETLVQDYLVVLDEFHLFYYWGESFRERMFELYISITSYAVPIIFLSATFSCELKRRLTLELELNYKDIYHVNISNQKLKNYPQKIFFYPFSTKGWMLEDCYFSKKEGTSLLFCEFRSQVESYANKLRSYGYKVLTCVGGEASQFILSLQDEQNADFIIATSVVSHGVNLPNIEKIYFNYKVENLDFYLQMLGRGGREGNAFECHVLNSNYFTRNMLILGFSRMLLKRLRIKVNSLLYYLYAC